MEDEVSSRNLHKTWKLVPRLQNQNVLECKWIQKVKEEQCKDGTLGTRLRARLVPKGYFRVEGVDHFETFPPLVKLTSTRTIMTMVTCFDQQLYQMNVLAAFLYVKLREDFFMTQPEKFISNDIQDQVRHLSNALYSLKQAPRKWDKTFDNFFPAVLDMDQNSADACVYIKR